MVCSSALINLARKMEERWGIPYFEGSFYGIADTSDAIRGLCRLLVDRGADAELLDRAEALMLQVHHRGKAVVAEGSRETMEMHVEALHGYGLWATVRQGGSE